MDRALNSDDPPAGARSGLAASKTKPVRKKKAPRSVASVRLPKLSTLTDTRREIARVYRLALSGEIELERMTKLIYALKELRACIEIDLLDEAPRRLAELRAWAEERMK